MGKDISPECVSLIRQALEDACADQERGIPGVTFLVANRDGKQIFAHAAGKRGKGVNEPMTLDSVFWIASFTKMITGIACMQLVEQGKLSLDDAEQVEGICPELKDLKVVQKDGSFVEKKRGITLRMLLTHTGEGVFSFMIIAGFGYSFFHKQLRDCNRPIGYDEFSGHIYDVLQPLISQPGEGFEYGVNIDWAGIIVERITGVLLNDYFQKNIFEPLGLKNISMLPSEEMKANLAYMHSRNADGILMQRDHVYRRPLIANDKTETKGMLNSGGAGCFANPQDYLDILTTLLNDGASPKTGQQLLTKSTVDQMFENQIPHMPNFGRQDTHLNAKPDFVKNVPDFYPLNNNEPQGWGLSFMITSSVTGRSLKSGMWAGIANLFWWCDREHGIAGVISTQILPFGDVKLFDLWADVEKKVYDSLK
ncbi:beta-lactamase family protein [Paracoccidioides lutzii Pb01]|uniref:Beta-lactamase family protein n=1 Tax=Paracoccidioides lutzii (strain ATCC MYA-826 / Pb01) TaxID=502779 RepID=C1GTJ7_PARBA|nr:beta-lactamase family protein [Paracoccidioides lutzii Pb01]EEH39653.1 beta-lactamase family protein [Paracoccidioides lutzii Pb01]